MSTAWGAALTLHDHLVHDTDDGDHDNDHRHGDHLAHDDDDKKYDGKDDSISYKYKQEIVQSKH